MSRPSHSPASRPAPAGRASARQSAWSQKWPLLLTATALPCLGGTDAALTWFLVLIGACLVGCLWAMRRPAAFTEGMAGASRYPARLRAATPQEQWASHRAGLYARADALAMRAAAGAVPSTLVVFEQPDLPELHAVFGARAAQRLAASFERKLQVLAGERGLAVRTGPTCWAVMLPSCDGDSALGSVRAALGTGMAVEADAADDEFLLVPRMAMRTLHDAAKPVRTVYQELREQISRLHALELRREEYLRRERESHSRRGSLGPAHGRAAQA